LQRGQLREARAAAGKALELNPASADVEMILGLLDTQESNLTGAERHFVRAVSLQPTNHRAQGYLGSTYLRQNKLGEAREAFLKVLGIQRGNVAAHYNLGLIAMLQDNPASALSHFASVHQSDASDVPALLGILECQLLLKQFENARESVGKIQALVPADSPALQQVGATLATHGEYELAVPLFRKFREAHPDSYDASYNLALALIRTGALDEAAGLGQQLVSRTGKAEAYNLLGTIQEKRGRHADAILAFEEAVRLAPQNEDFRIDHSGAVVANQDLERAVTLFSEIVRDFPKSLRARLGLGSVHYLLGKYEDAARVLLQTVQMDSKAAAAYDLLGKAFESVPGLQGEIKNVFRNYLRTRPRDPAAYAHYGMMLYLAPEAEGPSRFRAAKQYLREALAQDSRLAQAHLQLGIIAQTEGNLPEAVAALEKAVQLAPSYASAHYRLGTIYRKMGDDARAKVELELFQKLKVEEAEQERELVIRQISGKR
jgi:tetratricopeptide (TPR) repeat protein